ncbi:MAG: 50S ribosomal protein L13 [Candidatus Harrisonbacteria bacterium CG10_big_fil_rev_8_21_14_0_10_42_17]|uniref:Large ribosomal subunit protein uL13 n=1 Tax=Candidatus Harrisonbacteria bacterium CG10_big_fil_rev_8_21_14_0_10_42_17 TaxID=1974584 RepID=A0A2M6WHV8_9BACT|nr:MAG: 50S ribosomal protein L13 [Candidatus Harrisonbacteria bacterium CG10_big_fil_rev_8_21_14_0_10_42_17]
MEHIIDASGQKLGRLASNIALILQGKKHISYDPRLRGEDKVIVKNIKEVAISGRKADQKMYYHHTGYLGHLKEEKYKEVFAKEPQKVLYNAVFNMLPKNRLRQKRLNRLVIEK